MMTNQKMPKHNKKTCPDCQKHATDFVTALKLGWRMLRGGPEKNWTRIPPPPARVRQRAKELADKRLTTLDQAVREELGPGLSLLEAGEFVEQPRVHWDFPKWSFSCTLFDPIDRSLGAPPRIHMWIPLGAITIALGPEGRLGRLHGRAKWFEFSLRYTLRCDTVTMLMREQDDTVFSRYSHFYHCPRRKGHRGRHAHPWTNERLDAPEISRQPSVDT